MNQFVDAAFEDVTKSKKDALTANGAITRSTSGQSHLDLFAICGAARNAQEDVVRLFSKAYADDKALALRIMLWCRDIRGGAGERQAFRNVVKHLAENDPMPLYRLIPYVSEFGRWDDCIESLEPNSMLFQQAAKYLKMAIDSNLANAAKWTPRKGPVAIGLRQFWGMTPKEYRKFLVSHTNVVETKMCAKEWNKIEYNKLPSLAGLRYQEAFARNDGVRYGEFKNKLVNGEAKINVGTLFPHNIVANIRHGSGDALVLNESWKALPDYLGPNSGKVLVMSDVSGSMDTGIGGSATCMDVSIALGIYTAERLKGAFKDLVLTFSMTPELHKLQGITIRDRIANLENTNWHMNTNLQAAFELILKLADDNKVPAEDMPETLVIISDMEFDAAISRYKTNYGAIKAKYKDSGYKMPQIVFWNVNGRAGNNPVKFNADGVCMVSGYSPAILTSVLTGEEFDPIKVMLDTVMKRRYDVADQVV